MYIRIAFLLLVAAVNGVVFSASSSAATHNGLSAADTSTKEILNDCNKNGGTLAGRYRTGDLHAAYKTFRRDMRVADACAASIASQLAVDAPSGNRHQLLGDCLAYGRLTRSYSRRTLLRATRSGISRSLQGQNCLTSVVSQLRAKGSKISPKIKQVRTGIANTNPSDVVAQAIGHIAVWSASVGTKDSMSPSLTNFAVREIDGADPATARRIGPDAAQMWLLAARGQVCVARELPGPTFASACGDADRIGVDGDVNIGIGSNPDGTFTLWGVVPNNVRSVAVAYGSNERNLDVVRNGVFLKTNQLPSYVRWTHADGESRYVSTLTTPCDQRTSSCAKVPDPTRWAAVGGATKK